MICYSLQSDAVHIHVNPVEPMPSLLYHRFVVTVFYGLKSLLVIFSDILIFYTSFMDMHFLIVFWPIVTVLSDDQWRKYLYFWRVVISNRCKCSADWQICGKDWRQQALLSLLQSDKPESGIIFVAEQVCSFIFSILLFIF